MSDLGLDVRGYIDTKGSEYDLVSSYECGLVGLLSILLSIFESDLGIDVDTDDTDILQ